MTRLLVVQPLVLHPLCCLFRRPSFALDKQTVWRTDPHTLVKHLVYRHYLHGVFAKIARVNRTLQWWNLMLLLTVSFTPFPNAVVALPVLVDGPPGN